MTMISTSRVAIATAVLGAVGFAAPAFAAQSMITMSPGGSGGGWTQQMPTQVLGTNEAQVLTDGLSYIHVGAGPAGMVSCSHGMGNGAEMGFGVGASYTISGAFVGGIAANWKQQLMKSAGMAAAVNAGAMVGIAPAFNAGVGVSLPLTWAAGAGSFTAEPMIGLANVSAPGNADASVGLAYIGPGMMQNWSFMAQATPTYNLGGAGFSLPLAVGTRFSPTATSHVDLTIGSLKAAPAFGGTIGLVSLMGHVGY